MDAQSESFDLSKISPLPDRPLKIGNITVVEKLAENKRRQEIIDYFIICDSINISMSHFNMTEE